MKKLLLIFFWGLAISFLGALPIGTLNITVTNFVIKDNYIGALEFSVAAIVVEVLLVRIALSTLHFLQKYTAYYKLFNWVTICVLMLIAIISLNAAIHKQGFDATLPLTNQNPIISGLLLSILNPLHLPFWLGWSAVLSDKGILFKSNKAYNIYVVAIGIGSFLAFVLYGFIGKYLIQVFQNRAYLLNWVIGIALVITAIVQILKMYKVNKSSLGS